jgi:hypothetical protein
MADQQLVLGTYQSVFDNLKINNPEADPEADEEIEPVLQAIITMVVEILNNHRQERQEENKATRELLQAQGETASKLLQAQGETASKLLQVQGDNTGLVLQGTGQVLQAQGQLAQAQGQLLLGVIDKHAQQRRQELKDLGIFLLIGVIIFLVLSKSLKQFQDFVPNTNKST